MVLITATAILLSCYTSKYNAIGGQLRDLTAEFGHPRTSRPRRRSLKQQLALFHQRITAMWAASIALSLALLFFVVTVLAVIFVEREARIGALGATTLVGGLLLIAVAVMLELQEIRLARLTVAGELADVFAAEDDVSGDAA